MTCYSGENKLEWETTVKDLNDLSINLYPRILEKGINQEWKKVHKDFPLMEDVKIEELEPVKKAIEFLSNEKDNIDGDKATGLEKGALEVEALTRKFMNVMMKRVTVYSKYGACLELLTKLRTNEFNNVALGWKIKHKRAKDVAKKSLEESLMERQNKFEEDKAKVQNALSEYKKLSESLAALEELPFNEKFNKNIYINYWQMIKNYEVKAMKIDDYLQEQESFWADLLMYLDKAEDKGDISVQSQPSPPRNPEENKLKKFQSKLQMFKSICTERLDGEESMEELQTHNRQILDVQRELKEMMYNPEVKASKEDVAWINAQKDLTRELSRKISEKKEQTITENENRKTEIAANMRSMETIKFLPLHDETDWIPWKKNQKFLNTHPSDYKKAAQLHNTLRNPMDKEMLATIYDYKKCMQILNEKYNHPEKLVPALKIKLEKLNIVYNDEDILSNLRTILNVYEQLKEIGAKESFDGSVVQSMIKKMPTRRIEFERFKLMCKQMENIKDGDYTFDEDALMNIQGGEDEMAIDLVDNSQEQRRKFLQFIHQEAKILEYTKYSKGSNDFKKVCKKCNQRVCKCRKSADASIYTIVEDQCPVCHSKEPHLNKQNKPTKSLARCDKFRALKPEERKNVAFQNKVCFLCLCPGHSVKECRLNNKCFNCDEKHHHLICLKQKKKTDLLNHVSGGDHQKDVHLKISQIKVLYDGHDIPGIDEYEPDVKKKKFRMVNVLWDSGASINLVAKHLAAELGCVGVPEEKTWTTINESKPVRTVEHMIDVMDREGSIYNLIAYEAGKEGQGVTAGNSSILNRKTKMKYASAFKIPLSQLSNTMGRVDLLIGMGNAKIHPKLMKEHPKEEVQLFTTNFGPQRYMLGGELHLSKGEDIYAKPKENNKVYHVMVKHEDYWTGDQLGLDLPPKCSSCIKAPPCKQCKLLNHPVSFKEQEEGKVIKNSMTFDLEKNKIEVNYPYTKNIKEIFSPANSNKFTAERMAKNLKNSLKRDGLLETYTENFLDMEARGAIRELSPEEMEKWEADGNPINYCSHHAVLKDSKSTACRSVCNSSLSHNNTSLNALLPKGPTALSNLLHVIMRFRAKPFTVIADLKKAYNSVSTSERDCHLRRLLWYRKEDLEMKNPELRTFGMMVMAFGDTPAQYYLECAKEEVSNYIRAVMEDPALADAVISMSYVDDLALSVETKKEAELYAQKLPIGFGSYGFKIKEIFIGGPGVEQTSDGEDQLLFGHYYNLNEDKIKLRFAVNFSCKKRSQKTEPNLTSSSDLSNLEMTKRKVMSLLSSQYDPLGLASVFLAKYKIFLAKMFQIPEYDWDIILKDEHQKKAKQLVEEMIYAAENSPWFERPTKPEGYRLQKLIIFVDASNIALQVVVYGLYTCGDLVHTSLITAKTRITRNTIPRNELQAMVAGHRLALNVLEALDEPVPEVCFLGDSSCTLDSLKEAFVSKDIYVINRISEIRKSAKKMNCEVKYYHVESDLNLADKGTREDCKLDFLSSKEWQYGPSFIRNLEESPASFQLSINGSHKINMVALEERRRKKEEQEEDIWESLLRRSKSLKTVIRTLCIIMNIFRRKTFKGKTGPTAKEVNEAFLFLVRKTQESSEMERLKIKQLVTFKQDEIIYTQMRFPEHVRTSVFGKDKLPVIPGSSSLSKLLLSHAHQESVASDKNMVHNGIQQTLVNSRVGIYGSYITFAKHVIKGIVNSCPVCRRQAKELSNAKMSERQGGFGEVPPDGSCFNKIAMDYYGPFKCKTPRSRDMETRGTKHYKIYGMAVLCQQTRAVKFYPVEGYDTKSFLTTFDIHCSIHGVPTHVLSDPMTSFIAGAKVLEAEDLDGETEEETPDEESDFEENLERKYNIEWTFIPPGSQWRDPAERSIKSLKTMMQTIFNTEHNKPVLTINEYWNIFSQCSEILNRRPIQGYMDQQTIKFITPNQLLLGRTSKEAPPHTQEDMRVRPRLELLKNIKSQFWKQLMDVLAADSRLMKYPCWYKQSREPQPGDVVLVCYKTKVNDNYRMGKIISVDKNNRDITCRVTPHQDKEIWDLEKGWNKNYKEPAIMKIPVQRTILLYSPGESHERLGEDSGSQRPEASDQSQSCSDDSV